MKKRFVVDDKGKPVNFLLDIKTYRELVAGLEELECTKAYDAAKVEDSKTISYEQALHEIENPK